MQKMVQKTLWVSSYIAFDRAFFHHRVPWAEDRRAVYELVVPLWWISLLVAHQGQAHPLGRDQRAMEYQL